MLYLNYLFAAVVGYLIGSVPFGYLMVKTFFQKDIREFGSGNIGATNVYRFNKNLGITTFFLDAIKALIAIFFIWQVEILISGKNFNIDHARFACLLSGFFAVIGHIYSCFLKFKGGKGVSTMIGYYLYVSIIMSFFGLLAWFACFKYSRYSSLSSLAFSSLTFIYSLIFLSTTEKIFVLLMTLLVFYRHRDNIKRLINNQEKKID